MIVILSTVCLYFLVVTFLLQELTYLSAVLAIKRNKGPEKALELLNSSIDVHFKSLRVGRHFIPLKQDGFSYQSINWMSLFNILGASSICYVYHFNRICISFKQTAKIQMICRIMQHHTWVCTVCLCHIYGTLG